MAGAEAPSAKRGEARHEIKLPCEAVELYRLHSWLRVHPAGFGENYPQRRVNNVYFDTHELSNVESNLAGISNRSKIRLRWYGRTSGFEHATWEVKCRQSGMGWKVTLPVEEQIELASRASWNAHMKILVGTAHGPIGLTLSAGMRPTLINRYERRYFVSRDGCIRATLDFDLEFFDQRLSRSPNVSRPQPRHDIVILELKAPQEQYERLTRIVSVFPLRVTKMSKYVTGLIGPAV